jgi:hypothetical protein
MKISLLAVLSLLLVNSAYAQIAPSCDAKQVADKYQLLKRLSLDVRGKVPSYEEYLALEAPGALTPLAVANTWYTTEDFRLAMRRYHEALFWPNISKVRITVVSMSLGKTPDSIFVINSSGRKRVFRNDPDTNCSNVLQTNFATNKPGEFRPVVVNGDGGTIRQDGYRLVRPYWDPTTDVKVCGYEAQETLVADDGTPCDSPEAAAKRECGCGPNLRFCMGPAADTTNKIYASAREQLNLMVDDVTVGNKPYTELMLSRQMPTNGTLSFWRKYISGTVSPRSLAIGPDPLEAFKSGTLDFTDTAFVTVDRGTDLHAGVLTTPAYLLRFMTGRARANRFRQDFECAAFEPPQVLAPEPGCSETSGDLTKRCNCQYCHVTLEPLAAHWGQFAEAGTLLMSNTTLYPRKNMSCIGSSNATCERFYITNPDADNPGSLIPFQYSTRPDGTAAALAAGPRARANVIIGNGVFAKCATKRMFTYLMKREPYPSESAALGTVADGFKTNAYSLKWLMQELTSKPDYRSVR